MKKMKRREFFEVAGAVGVGVGVWSTTASALDPVPFVDVAVNPVGVGAWALDARGKIVSLGGAPVMGGPPEPERQAYVALGVTPDGKGLYALTSRGTLRTFGEALVFDTSKTRDHDVAFVDMAMAPRGDGLWALDANGKIFSFGAADDTLAFADVRRQVHVAIGTTPSGHGLYAMTRGGALRTSGDARAFRNDAPSREGSRFVDLAVTAAGDGLWLLDGLGRIVSLGAAPVMGGPPEPERQQYIALGVSANGQGLYAITEARTLRTFGDVTASAADALPSLGHKLPGFDAH